MFTWEEGTNLHPKRQVDRTEPCALDVVDATLLLNELRDPGSFLTIEEIGRLLHPGYPAM